jgi:4'-phosphopantetheinyl transferase
MAKISKHEQTPAWHPPPESLTLGRDEVHVWRAALDRSAADRQRLEQTLSADERTRAGRFYFQRDREQFIAARGLLRAILGRYLCVEPDQLRFGYSAHGKPALAGNRGQGSGVREQTSRRRPALSSPHPAPDPWPLTPDPCSSSLRFNLSHSHSLALYAITHQRELGVDLEFIRPEVVEEPIAERFFSAAEVAALRALPASIQPEAFFNCWTRKEAYIKARGEGLTIPLDAFEVSLAPEEPAALLSVNGDPAEAARWSLQALAPGPGYVAAVAVEGQDWQLRCWEWPLEKE